MEEYERITAFFEANESEYIEFQNVEKKRCNRPDLHAFLLLDELFPAEEGRMDDIVSDAQHDEIWISISFDDICLWRRGDVLSLFQRRRPCLGDSPVSLSGED